MKKFIYILVSIAMLGVAAQAQTWSIDPNHSKIGFYVRHMVLSKVYGEFHDFTATVNSDGTNWDKGTAEFTIKTASIDTDNETRNGHLKSPDFFDVEKYPTITFKSKKVIKGEGNKLQVVGDLTIRDVTKEVTFDGEFLGMIPGKDGKDRAGFSLAGVINRQDYHVSWSKTLDNGGLVAGDDVNIFIELELVKDVPATKN